MFLKNFTGATAYTHQINFVPEFLLIKKKAGAMPATLRVSVAGDGVIGDYTLDAMKAISEAKVYQSPVTADYLVIPLADGLISGKVVDIDFTAGAGADSFDVFAISKNKGSMYLRCMRQTVLANSGVDIEAFLHCMVASYAQGDIISVEYRTGVKQTSHVEELLAWEFFNTAQDAPSATITISNFDQSYKRINLIPTANRQLFIWRFEAIGGLNKVNPFDEEEED